MITIIRIFRWDLYYIRINWRYTSGTIPNSFNIENEEELISFLKDFRGVDNLEFLSRCGVSSVESWYEYIRLRLI